MDVEAFIRDGYAAIRGAFEPDTAAACRDEVWRAMASRGVRPDHPATWPAAVEIDCPEGGPFVTAGTSPALAAAYDELIGPGRWAPRDGVGGAVPERARQGECRISHRGQLRLSTAWSWPGLASA